MDGATGVTTQTHLAAHLLREIEGRLHEVFSPMLSREAKERIAEAGKNEESHRAKIGAAAEILGLDGPALEQWLEYALQLRKLDKEGAKRIEVGFPSPRRHANRLVDRVSEAEDEQERLVDGTEFGCLETSDGAAESLRVNDRRLLDEHAGGTKKT